MVFEEAYVQFLEILGPVLQQLQLIALRSADEAMSVLWSLLIQALSISDAGCDRGSPFVAYFAMYRIHWSVSTMA